jgi:hypothetical protein
LGDQGDQLVNRRALLAGLPLWVSAAAAQPLTQGATVPPCADRMGCFDGRLSGGTPSLDLSFMNGTLPPGVTFTRASTGTYIDATGTMRTAAVNAPRFESRGLLIEEARANSLLNSDTLDPTGDCVASTDIPPLRAGATLWKLTWPVGQGNGAIWGINLPIVIGTAYAASCWLYIPSAYNTSIDNLPEFNVDVGANGSGGYNTGILADGTKRNQWQRLTGAVLAGTGGSTTCNLVIRRGNAYGGATLGGSVCYLCCPQFEVGGFVTSYIPTGAAAVTRAVDVCDIPVGAWFNPNTYSLMAEFTAANVPSETPAGIGDGVFANSTYLNNAGFICSQSGGGTAFGSPMSSGVINKQCGTYSAALLQCCNNAGAVGAVAAALPGQSTATRLSIGCTPWALDGQINGYIRRVRYWPRVLSAGELQAVTS